MRSVTSKNAMEVGRRLHELAMVLIPVRLILSFYPGPWRIRSLRLSLVGGAPVSIEHYS